MFQTSNSQISPSEIEDVLMSHPLVAEACVIGITSPDGLGYTPKGFVVLKNPAAPEISEAIMQYANGN